jgi:hypothetical protein
MSEHFLNRCSCGQIIGQCRCPGPKTEYVTVNGCPACQAEMHMAHERDCMPDFAPEAEKIIGGLSYQDKERILTNLLSDLFCDIDSTGRAVFRYDLAPGELDPSTCREIVEGLRREFVPEPDADE